METKKYLNLRECHDYTGIPTSTLYKKVESHEIPHIRVGKRIRFSVESIDNWMTSNEVKPMRKDNRFFVSPNVIDKVAHPV